MDKEYKAEAGKFQVWIAKNSEEGLMGAFELVGSGHHENFGEML